MVLCFVGPSLHLQVYDGHDLVEVASHFISVLSVFGKTLQSTSAFCGRSVPYSPSFGCEHIVDSGSESVSFGPLQYRV